MAKRATSEFHELLKLLRRIVVLGLAAWGLVQNVSYGALAFRLCVLWAVLYLASGLIEVMLQYFNKQSRLKKTSGEAGPSQHTDRTGTRTMAAK